MPLDNEEGLTAVRVFLMQSPFTYPHAHAGRLEPLGLTYLAAAIRDAGHSVSIYDPTIGPPTKTRDGSYRYCAPRHEIETAVREARPDVVGISCQFSFWRDGAIRLASLVRQCRPQAVTVIGGGYPSFYREKALAAMQDGVDYMFQGESERSFCHFLSIIEAGTDDLASVDGLMCMADGAPRINEKRQFITDVDGIAFPARVLLDIQRYMNSGTVMYGVGTRPVLSLLTSRSCPYRCTFCNTWQAWGPRWRARSPENVLAELDEIVHKYGAKDLHIMDDNFTFNADRTKIIAEGMIRRNYGLRWNTPNGISARGVDREMALLMKRSGCVNVCIAIESGSEHIRRKVMRKPISDQQIEAAVRHFKDAGIQVGAFLIIGMPGEDKTHFRQTVNLVNRLPLDFINPSFALPKPGTRLHKQLADDRIIDEDYDPGLDNLNTPAFVTPDFTTKDLLAWRRRLLLSFYGRRIPRMVCQLLTGRLTWMAMDTFHRGFHEKVLARAS